MTNKVKKGQLPSPSSSVAQYYSTMVVSGKHIRNINFDKCISVSTTIENEIYRLNKAKRKDQQRYNTKN
jgi:hypothetical protein